MKLSMCSSTMDKAFDFLRSTRPAGEFSQITGISQDTLRDWRKRDMSIGYGQPLPNGYWGYSMKDAMKVHLAKTFIESGFEWKDALWMGHIVGGYLTGKFHYKGQKHGDLYQARYLVFHRPHKEDRPEHRTGDDLTDIVQRIFETYAPPMVHVVDLISTFTLLPKEFRSGLVALEGHEG